MEDYPEKSGDTSIQVVQIAEGENGELFVYVYQPGIAERELRASYINMSLQSRTDRNPTYNLYSLTWLNSDGVFAKYIVNNFKVSNDEYRYYNIATIYRPFNKDIDDPAEASDDLNSHMGYAVGYCYCAYSYNGTVVYECDKVEVVDIEILAVGSVRYTNGFKLYVDKCDAHFVAFSVTNYDIDKILDATVVYTTQDYIWQWALGVGESEEYGNPVTLTKDISSMETASNDGDGLFGVKYEWQRILTKTEFEQQLKDFKNEDVEFSKGDLGSAQFVFQFLETDYTLSGGSTATTEWSTKVTDVGILRLHFLVGQTHYNLGVVSDLVSDDGIPDFEITISDNFENEPWWQKLMAVLLLILLIIVITNVFFPIAKPIFKIILNGLGVLLNVAFSIITFPLRLIFNTKRK